MPLSRRSGAAPGSPQTAAASRRPARGVNTESLASPSPPHPRIHTGAGGQTTAAPTAPASQIMRPAGGHGAPHEPATDYASPAAATARAPPRRPGVRLKIPTPTEPTEFVRTLDDNIVKNKIRFSADAIKVPFCVTKKTNSPFFSR